MNQCIVILDAKVEFDMGMCKDMWEALDKFKEEYPMIEQLSKEITVRIIKEKSSG